MDCIAMTETYRIEHLSVVIACCRAPDNLILSVAVDIRNRHVVVAVGIHRIASQSRETRLARIRLCGAVGIHHLVLLLGVAHVEPTCLQLSPVEVHRPDIGVGIIAATEDARGVMVGPVEIGCGSQVALAAVAIVPLVVLAAPVIPVESACRLTQFRLRIAGGVVGNGVDGLASQSVEHREVLMSAVDAPTAVTPVLGVAGSLDLRIAGRLIHVLSFSVLRTRRRLAHQLRLSVAIVVIYLKLRIVSACADIYS